MEIIQLFVDKLSTTLTSLGPKVLAAIVMVLAGYVLARLFARGAFAAIEKRPRGATLAPLMRSVVYVLIFLSALFVALDHVGVPIATLIAGAGVAGLAIGFGAQALVKDVISGFFHIVEGVIAVGDVIQLGDVTGVVEEVGLRVTKVRTFNGQLWYIPNGTIDRVGNFNRGWCRAVVEVPIAYEHDVRRGMSLLKEVGEGWAKENRHLIYEEPAVEGALGLNESNVTVRLVIKVKAQEHWAAERELRLRAKEAFAKEGIEIPYPRQVVYHRQEPGRTIDIGTDGGRPSDGSDAGKEARS